MVAHGKVTRNPLVALTEVDLLPYLLIDVVQFAHISDLLGVELDSAREHVDVLAVEDAASSRVSGYVELCDSVPLVLSHVIVFTIGVEVFSVVASDSIDPVHVTIIDRREI